MKKSQRQRLAALLAKDSTKLSVAEKSELSTLQALAATHSDASKDIDDTKISAGQFLKNLGAAITAKAELAAQLAEANAKIAELTGRLEVANTEHGALDTDKAAVVAAKTELESKLAASVAAFGAVSASLGLKADEFLALAADKMQAAINAKIDAAATDKLASLGFPLSGLPPAATADSGAADDKVMTHSEFNKLSAHAKMKFCRSGGRLTDLKLTGAYAHLFDRN